MATHQQHTTAVGDRVPWNQLIAYGTGGLIPIALFNIAGQLMSLLGNISLGLSAFWLGVIMIFPRLWDAVSDPIVGHLSDNTRSRWGRRRPYILLGGIGVATSFVAMWWVPRGDAFLALFPSEEAHNWFQLAFILGGLLAFFTACTIFEIPHGALGMEMSTDYHERTRLFSAKSFFGNLFAMGTPWLIAFAGLKFFRGPGGDMIDGMKYVSMLIAAVLIPIVYWWFLTLDEPGFAIAKEQKKTSFWKDIRTTLNNKTFLRLVVIIFTLAMGFNFVGIFNYYITIFFLYGGDVIAAGPLLGIAGTIWAITGLLAVFPLNWISKRLGKNKTLLLAILLMCAAQLAKIVCYSPQYPYLVLIPTMLLSTGMLMFFTLGASMVGDVCDENELKTGNRSEGSYYSIYWWFIKMGTAFASFVTGILLVYTSFDEKQNVSVEALQGSLAIIKSEAELWQSDPVSREDRIAKLEEQIEKTIKNTIELETHFLARLDELPQLAEHTQRLIEQLDSVRSEAKSLQLNCRQLVAAPAELVAKTDRVLRLTTLLKKQSPRTLFRLRFVEIGLPLLLSIVSIQLARHYPLTESRCYEINESLKKRRAKTKTMPTEDEFPH